MVRRRRMKLMRGDWRIWRSRSSIGNQDMRLFSQSIQSSRSRWRREISILETWRMRMTENWRTSPEKLKMRSDTSRGLQSPKSERTMSQVILGIVIVRWNLWVRSLCLIREERLSSTKLRQGWADSPGNSKQRARARCTTWTNTDPGACTAPTATVSPEATYHKRCQGQLNKWPQQEDISTSTQMAATINMMASATQTTTSTEESHIPPSEQTLTGAWTQVYQKCMRKSRKKEEHRCHQMRISDCTISRRFKAGSQMPKTKRTVTVTSTPKCFWQSMLFNTLSTKSQNSKGKVWSSPQSTTASTANNFKTSKFFPMIIKIKSMSSWNEKINSRMSSKQSKYRLDSWEISFTILRPWSKRCKPIFVSKSNWKKISGRISSSTMNSKVLRRRESTTQSLRKQEGQRRQSKSCMKKLRIRRGAWWIEVRRSNCLSRTNTLLKTSWVKWEVSKKRLRTSWSKWISRRMKQSKSFVWLNCKSRRSYSRHAVEHRARRWVILRARACPSRT